MSPHSVPLKTWLKARRAVNALHLELMALNYDLDGALASGQYGLAWWTQQNMLTTAVELSLSEAGTEVPPSADPLDRAFTSLDLLRRAGPERAATAWELLLRTQPQDSEVREESARTLAFIEHGLGLPRALTRQGAVREWAESTALLRAVAKHVGVARSDTWYLSRETGPDTDWYSDVLAVLADERLK
ncbi:hypothetical protein OHR86_33005 [Streptomyces sp. NBC_00441]|uniref:hypothetical protein n=1 Tax=Streptomyces sp. NBC_00441 TaxID=2975742 RepID=UPI002E2A5637|nr:hypothetical protein [Streptomyces sp. NBC_00441]